MPEFNIQFDPEDVDPREQDQEKALERKLREALTEAQAAIEQDPEPDPAHLDQAGVNTYDMLRDIMARLASQWYPDGIPPETVAVFLAQFTMQLRKVYTFEEVHEILHRVLLVAEKNIHSQNWIDPTTGEAKERPILAEEYRGIEGGPEMVKAIEDGISDDDLKKLLDGDEG